MPRLLQDAQIQLGTNSYHSCIKLQYSSSPGWLLSLPSLKSHSKTSSPHQRPSALAPVDPLVRQKEDEGLCCGVVVLSNASEVTAAANPIDRTSAPPPPSVRVNSGSGREAGEEPE
jgi:hypothetical protein